MIQSARGMQAPSLLANRVGSFLRADARTHYEWVVRSQAQLVWFCVAAIVMGSGVYGAAMGCWRGPLQALYTGIKLPLVILLTTLANGLLNGMLAPLLGLNASFRQSLVVVLMTFAIASVILGALSPVALFVVWNTPPLTAATHATSPEYGMLQLTLTIFIAVAGIMGNLRVVPLLCQWSHQVKTARRVLVAWLVVNLLLGSQISWVLRPFIWDPRRPVEFIGPDSLRGSFYETVFEAAGRLMFR